MGSITVVSFLAPSLRVAAISQKGEKVLKTISQGDAQRLREFFREVGYEDKNLYEKGYRLQLPSSRMRNTARLLDRVREPSLLHLLLRLFLLNAPQDAAACADVIPLWFTELALSCGLLRRDGEKFTSEVTLFPADGFLAVCDPPARIDAQDPEAVLWPNPTTKLLANFTIRCHSRATLDLGTGNAMQAVSAAGHSDQVVATDLNPRAVEYAKFTARLNGIENIECLTGDGFAPVAGRKFDLITSNPPFFIRPSHAFLFCDNPMDLDQLCRRFVKEAPEHLHEGGYFQLLCEWAVIRGQSMHERVTEWMQNTGCDAWVIKGHVQDLSEYAQELISRTRSSPDGDAELYASYMEYYRSRNVEAIQDGAIAMRKRSGRNWILIEELSDIPKGPFGESVQEMFRARDFLDSHASEEQMLAAKLRLAPHARLERFFQSTKGRWQPTALNLRLTKGLPFFIGVQPEVAEFLGACDGNKTLGELVASFARGVDAPLEKVQSECLGVSRRLLEHGFLLGD